ncbi:MAG: NUDIX domain-containing protein [Halorhabdus sp.]
MEEISVVTCFLRNRGEILLVRRSDDVGSSRGQWAGVSGHAEGDPDGAARLEIAEETGLETDVTLRTRGEPFAVADDERRTRWIVHPYLFETETREIEPNWESAEYEWVPPTAILRRETVPDLWTSYDRVRPTVETITTDRAHGSAWLSIRALEVLRDEAGFVASGGGDDDRESIAETARDLRDARPSMPVIENRVNRVMARASGDAERVVEIASEELESALEADTAAATLGAARLPDRVATLSRSGTVLTALENGDPDAVLVAESRPGGEGVDVAESLADSVALTLSSDAGFAWAIHDWDADALLVGADAIGPDGSVRNKVGTRSAALAAAHEGIDCLVVAAADKVDPDPDPELEAAGDLYDGAADIAISSPLFDVTPPVLVDAIYTDEGVLSTGDIDEIAEQHRENARWDD